MADLSNGEPHSGITLTPERPKAAASLRSASAARAKEVLADMSDMDGKAGPVRVSVDVTAGTVERGSPVDDGRLDEINTDGLLDVECIASVEDFGDKLFRGASTAGLDVGPVVEGELSSV